MLCATTNALAAGTHRELEAIGFEKRRPPTNSTDPSGRTLAVWLSRSSSGQPPAPGQAPLLVAVNVSFVASNSSAVGWWPTIRTVVGDSGVAVWFCRGMVIGLMAVKVRAVGS